MMRGGPRMMCSPYLTGSLAVMLVLVTFNYWSVSTTNFDLVKEVKQMQVQLKTGSGALQDKDKALLDKDKDFLLLKEKLEQSQGRVEELRKKVTRCENNLTVTDERRAKEAEAANKKIDSLKETVAQNEQESEKNALKAEEEKEVLEKEVSRLKDDLEAANTELVSLKAESAARPGHGRPGSPAAAPYLPGGALGRGQLADVDPKAVSVIQKETRGGAPGGGPGPRLPPLRPPPGPSSPKPQGISSSKKPSVIVNVGGVMPPPGNLDQAEDDSHIPENENGPEGKKDLQDDDQDPDGQIEDGVELEKQNFLEEKTDKDTKDVVVASQEDKLDALQDSFNQDGVEGAG